jgi:hypothetical protein
MSACTKSPARARPFGRLRSRLRPALQGSEADANWAGEEQ